MKRQIVKLSMVTFLLVAFAADASAQRNRNRRGNNPPPANTQSGNQSGNTSNTNPPTYDPYGNIPLRVDSSSEGMDSITKKSLRPDGAFDRTDIINARTPLPYEHLRWDDALYAEKVWRELDFREKMNQTFRYNAKEDNGDQQFIGILLTAIKKGEVVAFADERFTTPLTLQQVQEAMGGSGSDTTNVTAIDDPSKIVERVVTPRVFNLKSVTKMRLKEEWVFDRESSRMFARIVGLCPVKTEYIEGTTRERGVSQMFWVYYPDLRPVLARYDVYNPKNMGVSRMTWEELFEARMFSSYIIKSTLDNSSMRPIAMQIKDPILRLLEGDNIKERIFNYEQDLWSY
jgi:gliding motility associated protien GldN